QQGQTLWFSRFTNLIATSSVVRYGTLIFLVALISVLYFATTHQVMKTSGGNASVYSERMFVTNNPLSPDSNGDNKIVYDKSNQIGDIKSVNNNNVLGFLYDRGNGCFRYPNLNNTITSVIPPEIPTNFQSRRIGFILDDSSCSLDKQI
ncbi:1269_t:CDS:1, partial [Scutellospora calospora]